MARHESGSLLGLLFGQLDVAAAAGAITDTDLFGAYIKQLVTNSEWIVANLGGVAGRTRVVPSVSATVEENAYQQFSISIMDIDTGSVPSADIDITGISQVLSKSTGGGAFSAVGITQPTFGKADGRVFEDYQFLAAEWAAGDVYKLVVSGIEATVGGDTAYIPAVVWSNLVTEQADISADTDPLVMGRAQIAATTIDLNQAAAAYVLFTGATQAVVLESLIVRCPNIIGGGALTSIAVATDDVTPGVIIDSLSGAVANLTAEAQLAWSGEIYIPVGTEIELTIGGGAHGVAYVCDVVAKYRSVASGGVLT